MAIGYRMIKHYFMPKDIKSYNDKGKKHGLWEVYWSNGQLRFKGNYINGQRIGYWIFNNKTLFYV
jgi:antitoxin component YwqK of YwqJK toxin-antitoxin module